MKKGVAILKAVLNKAETIKNHENIINQSAIGNA